MTAVAVVLALVLAAGVYGLSQVLGSSSPPAAATVSQPSGPVDWLGMQIESLPPDSVVIDTVASGSSAEQAGLEPGDVIVEVNGRAITTPSDISSATASLRAGSYVSIQVSRGSTLFSTDAVLAGPPSSHP